MTTAIAPQGANHQLAALPLAAIPAPIDKAALRGYLDKLEDPEALELQQRLAKAYDAACRSLIGANDVQIEGSGKNAREFKKKSAWRKLGRYFGISSEVIRVEKEFLGEEFLATVTVRATAPWGQSLEAVGSCGTDEEEGRRRITMADAVATAETRATNRGTSNLVAMGEVSAEEIGDRNGGRPEMGLEDANAVIWPWDQPEKYVGKPFAEVSTLSLLRVLDWAQKKIEGGRAGRQVHRLHEAAVLVIESRPDREQAQKDWEAEQEKKAQRAPEAPAAATAAADPAAAPAAEAAVASGQPAAAAQPAAPAEPPAAAVKPPTHPDSFDARVKHLNALMQHPSFTDAARAEVKAKLVNGASLAEVEKMIRMAEKLLGEGVPF